MKQRLQTSLSQHLVMTPKLQQAIRLLQMSTVELEAEIIEAVETNPLLDWVENTQPEACAPHDQRDHSHSESPSQELPHNDEDGLTGETPYLGQAPSAGGGSFDDDNNGLSAAERIAETESLKDHLLWQLHLSPLSEHDRRIGTILIDSIDDDGYLRTSLAEISDMLQPVLTTSEYEIQTVLSQIQRFDPIGVGARSLSECLCLQLELLPSDTPRRGLALTIAASGQLLEKIPRSGAAGLASGLQLPQDEVEEAIALLRSLNPKPGLQIGDLAPNPYVVPDCIIWRQRGVWRVALSNQHLPKIAIHRGYESMIRQCNGSDADYLRGCLQDARWLLKNLEARGETLLKVTRCLIRQQAGFLEFGEQALRPLTLREIADEIGMHESTVSRAIAHKYVRTPRGTLPLRAFFSSGVSIEGGGEASTTAIQSLIRKLIDTENPQKPLSDAKLAGMLKTSGVPVARRTVAKYREAMDIPSSHERTRMS